MEFAQKLGLGQSTLSGVEKGRQAPTARMLADVAEITGCDLNWLLLGQGAAKPAFPTVAGNQKQTPMTNEIWRNPGEAGRPGDIYADYVPLLGYYGEGGIIEDPNRDQADGLERYIGVGKMPEGSAALKLLGDASGFPGGTVLVFGPEEKSVPRTGSGLLHVEGQPAYLLAAWQRAGRGYKLFRHAYAAGTVPAASVTSARLFLAHF